MTELHELTAVEAGALLDAKKISSIELVDALLARIERCDGAVNAVGEVTNDAGGAVRKLQNGAIPTYAFSIFLGVVAVVLYFVFAH